MGMLICPKCKKELMQISGKSYIDKKCKDCNRLVVFNPETQETKIKRVPLKSDSRGCRFY